MTPERRHPRNRSRRPSRRRRMTPVSAVAAAASPWRRLAPATASADTISYVKDDNVWIAEPGGTKQHSGDDRRLEQTPYRYPSQADDGTIVAAQRRRDRRAAPERRGGAPHRRAGADGLAGPQRRRDRRPRRRLARRQDDRVLVLPLLVPGRGELRVPRIARVRARGRVGDPSAGAYGWQPSFVSNSRVLAFGGAGSQVGIHDVGSGQPTAHWFDDDGYPVPTDLERRRAHPVGQQARAGPRLRRLRRSSSGTRSTGTRSADPAPAGRRPCARPAPRRAPTARRGRRTATGSRSPIPTAS